MNATIRMSISMYLIPSKFSFIVNKLMLLIYIKRGQFLPLTCRCSEAHTFTDALCQLNFSSKMCNQLIGVETGHTLKCVQCCIILVVTNTKMMAIWRISSCQNMTWASEKWHFFRSFYLCGSCLTAWQFWCSLYM